MKILAWYLLRGFGPSPRVEAPCRRLGAKFLWYAETSFWRICALRLALAIGLDVGVPSEQRIVDQRKSLSRCGFLKRDVVNLKEDSMKLNERDARDKFPIYIRLYGTCCPNIRLPLPSPLCYRSYLGLLLLYGCWDHRYYIFGITSKLIQAGLACTRCRRGCTRADFGLFQEKSRGVRTRQVSLKFSKASYGLLHRDVRQLPWSSQTRLFCMVHVLCVVLRASGYGMFWLENK